MKNALSDAAVSSIANHFILALCAVSCLLYTGLGVTFAEINIRADWFPAPFFIGEMLLLTCCLLSFLGHKEIKRDSFSNSWVIGLVAVVFIVKTVFGYFEWGALTFRHAAVFYYSLFAWIVYQASAGFKYNRQWPIFVVYGVSTIMLFSGIKTYTYFPFMVLLLVLSMQARSWVLKSLIIASLTFLLFQSCQQIFDDGRSRIIANATGFILVLIAVLNAFIKNHGLKVFLALTGGAFVIMLALTFSDKTALRSMTALDKINTAHKEFTIRFQKGKSGHVKKELQVALFQTERPLSSVALNDNAREDVPVPVSTMDTLIGLKSGVEPFTFYTDEPVLDERSETQAVNNILFRLYIWQDMLEDYSRHNFLLGADFGYPFRSIRLEVLSWAEEVWSKLGWVPAHNAFLTMLFYGGLLGAVLVLFIIYSPIQWFFLFGRYRLWQAQAGAAVLIFWLIVSSFNVTLEVPQFAIPFWCLFGLLLRMEKNVLKKNDEDPSIT